MTTFNYRNSIRKHEAEQYEVKHDLFTDLVWLGGLLFVVWGVLSWAVQMTGRTGHFSRERDQ